MKERIPEWENKINKAKKRGDKKEVKRLKKAYKKAAKNIKMIRYGA